MTIFKIDHRISKMSQKIIQGSSNSPFTKFIKKKRCLFEKKRKKRLI